jgi:hypothetical protein
MTHILSLGLELLWLGKSLYLWAWILDSKARTANLTQDATSTEPKPGVFAVVCWIRAWSASNTLQT